MATANIYDMVDTWNDGATTFTAIKMNVTDTASDASSLLMDLQVGGSSKFKVDKAGKVVVETGSAGSPSVIFSGLADTTGIYATSDSINFNFTSVSRLSISADGAQVRNLGVYSWSNAASASATTDLILARDAAGTLAQRNSTNAQTFNLYNTYTDASNYERGFMKWNSNVLQIGTEAAGTGSGRALRLLSATTVIEFGSNGSGLFYGSSLFLYPAASGSLYLRGNASASGITVRNNTFRHQNGVTVSNLEATPSVGMISRVTDANSPSIGSTVTGGGAANALCWYNGTNWTVIGV